jgi:leucyl/phenylalanyl-tRNA--protein transferase
LSEDIFFFKEIGVLLLSYRIPNQWCLMKDYLIADILEGYRHGYFLMANEETNELQWYKTQRERTIIPLDERFRYPRSLTPVLNQQVFSTTINLAFAEVVKGCADRKTTWISKELKEVYLQLHQAGWAHSFETWQGQELAGGILGIALGGAFIGESMFYRIPNGSKVAMVKLVEHLRSKGFILFDAQLQNPHLERFGSINIPQLTYQALLQEAIQRNCSFS